MPMAIAKEQSPYKVLVIGEAPGQTEDDKGFPFIGKTGQFLRENFPPNWEKKLYWQNTVRCRPPKNRTPTPREVSCCANFLKQDILSLRPHAILGIGNEALNYFWPDAPTISKIRGIPFPVIVGDHVCWFTSTFHPSYVARAEREDYADGSTVNTVLPLFQNDLINFFENVKTKFQAPPKIKIPPKEILYPKTKQEVLNLFHKLRSPYAIDFETFKFRHYQRDARLLTCGCSDGILTFSFKVRWPGDLDPWGMEVLTEMMLSDKEWIAQHASMELPWIVGLTKNYKQKLHDTEILARLLHKRKGLGSLDVLSRIYFGIDVKQLTNNALAGQGLGPLDKERLSEYSPEQVLEYNALDAWAEALLYYQMLEMLPPVQLPNYRRSVQTVQSTVAMEVQGLNYDIKESESLQKDLFKKSQACEKEASLLPEVRDFEKKESKIFSISSGQTLAYVLDKYYHYQVPTNVTAAGKINYVTEADELEKLAEKKSCRLIDLTLEYREVEKQKSTYVDPILKGRIIGVDGLIHGQYTVVHTNTYRLSGADPNMQNWPKRKHREVRRQIIPPPGYMFAAFDYGQLEGRVIAMFSKDPVLKKAFVDDDDIHWKWLYRIIKAYPAYMDRLKQKTGETTEKHILKGGRTIIKTDFVFASFYGSIAKSIATRTGIPLRICEEILHEFWTEYKVTKAWVDGQFRRYKATGTVASLTGRERNEVLPGNEVINTPVQGTAAELVLEAQNALFEMAIETDMNLLPRVNVHDDLIFAIPDSDKTESYITTIGVEIVKPRFPFVTVPLMTEARVGYNWCDLETLTKFTGSYF
jgi:DNA polymerase-1